MKQETAETIALNALGWLVGNDELLPVFLGSSGMSIGDLRTAAHDPQVLVSIIDFICLDDNWVISFCDAQGLAYDQLQRVRQALPGGAQVHWT